MGLKDKFIKHSYNEGGKFKVKNEQDLEYMNSVSSAMLMHTTLKTRLLLWVGAIVIVWLIVWAYFAKIDALTRGQGKVVPSHQVQVIQNLEGGIVSEILFKEGDNVKKGDVLIKIDDTTFLSNYEESKLRYDELEAKTIRLRAESTGKPFYVTKEIRKKSPKLIKYEESLYRSNKAQLNNNIQIYTRRLKQKRNELKEARSKLLELRNNYKLITKEVEINKPLVKSKIISEVEFLKLQREQNNIKSDMRAVELSIPRLKSVIEEQKDNIKEVQYKFRNAAKEAFNKAIAEMKRIKSSNIARQDKVKRTFVRSPVDGTIKQILVNTIGGVVKPGMDIIEIVPTQDTLIVETKIRPADIAFLYPGQKAIVKFTAYDFAIYGSLSGVITNISADTIIDDIDRKSYYIVRVKTDKSYLGSKDKKLNIIVGMTANVDIVTGKKTVLEYILKPILRARENVWSER